MFRLSVGLCRNRGRTEPVIVNECEPGGQLWWRVAPVCGTGDRGFESRPSLNLFRGGCYVVDVERDVLVVRIGSDDGCVLCSVRDRSERKDLEAIHDTPRSSGNWRGGLSHH